MRFARLMVVALVALFFLSTARAQSGRKTLTGKVFTEDGREGLGGVSISVKGTRKGVTTAPNGTFHLDLDPSDQVLIFSFAGYEPITIDARNADVSSILLKKSSRQMEEVLVTGYSTQSRKFISGSIASVKGDAIKNIPEAGFNQLLQGKTTGVQVLANSGTPGGGITFRVRGNNSINASVDPLYVIDGVFVNTAEPLQTGIGGQEQSNPLADINPSDIESIQILKDANATAIYGSLGANGVILVTTKRGRLNSRPKVTLNTYHGWSNAIKKYSVVNGPQTGILTNESTVNTAIDNGQNPATVVFPFPNPDTLPTYDRISPLFRTAATSDYEASIVGGSEKSIRGLSLVQRSSVSTGIRVIYFSLFTGIVLTGFGSAYYHLSPNNSTLVFDRLPMTIVFMALLAAVISEFVSPAAGKILLTPLLLTGVASVLWWHYTGIAGNGDLRMYILVQYYPMLLIPLILLLFRAPADDRSWHQLGWVFGWYFVAKAFDLLDCPVWSALGIVSGHTLKHLAAGLATWYLVRMFQIKYLAGRVAKLKVY